MMSRYSRQLDGTIGSLLAPITRSGVAGKAVWTADLDRLIEKGQSRVPGDGTKQLVRKSGYLSGAFGTVCRQYGGD